MFRWSLKTSGGYLLFLFSVFLVSTKAARQTILEFGGHRVDIDIVPPYIGHHLGQEFVRLTMSTCF
jgi:hypothetical protein